LKKGDLGGFKNHQWEGIFGKRYRIAALVGSRKRHGALEPMAKKIWGIAICADKD